MHNMGDSEDSEIDVCSVDDEITSANHTGLTLVAAETYVSNHHNYEEQIVPLTSDDLLTRNKLKASHAKSKHAKNNHNGKKSTHKEKVASNESKDNVATKHRLHVNKHKVEAVCDNTTKTHDKEKYSFTPAVQTADKHNGRQSGEVFGYDKDDIKKEDEGDVDSDGNGEMFDRGINECLNRFHFESDHLAIKNNTDYHALLQTLTMLESQRTQAIKDLEMLHVIKDDALTDPLKFVKNLQEGKLDEFPTRQVVAKPPDINWIHYMMAYSGDKYVPQITTRNAVKVHEPDMAETIDMDCLDDNSMDSLSGESFAKFKSKVDGKPATHKQKWSTEEQEKLEKLLLLYPPEEVEARRWEKIAKALGTRTSQQVQSRIQKYFVKLAKAKLPIPGRGPSNTMMSHYKRSKINPVSYKNSSFFPSWRPNVYMNEDDGEEMGDFLDEKPENCLMSDEDESVPDELKQTPEYKELMQLKKIKKYRALKEESQSKPEFHRGYMCDNCKLDPIIGVRWHCMQCPVEQSTDFCNNCAQSGKLLKSDVHTTEHQLMPVYKPLEADAGLDDDYLAFEQRNKFKYNYLDPNFIPCR